MTSNPTPPSLAASVGLILLGLCLLVAGLFFVSNGLQLAKLDDSWYFLLAGLALVLSGVRSARARQRRADLRRDVRRHRGLGARRCGP